MAEGGGRLVPIFDHDLALGARDLGADVIAPGAVARGLDHAHGAVLEAQHREGRVVVVRLRE